MSNVKAYYGNIKKLWFAFRTKWASFGFGLALDWDEWPQVWLVFRLGPFHFDIAWSEEKPKWS